MAHVITYQYNAITPDGIKTRGVVQAADEFSAVEKIKATCPIVTKITPVSAKSGNILQKDIGGKTIDAKALSVMCSQFSIILRSGVPISKCMELIANQTEDKRLKKMLIGASEDVAEGTGIAKSFENNCKFLPITFIETIRAGEESGTLERSFQTLEKYYDKSYKTQQKVKRAMSYPIFVLCVAVVVLLIVMIKVIPTLADTFGDLGGELPAMTKFLIGTSNFFADSWPIILGVIFAVVIAAKLLLNTEKGRVWGAKRKLTMPVFGNINTLGGAAQFANTMATLLEAGIPVNKAIETTAKVMDNYQLSIETRRMAGSIEEGKQLGDCMRKCESYPATLTEMCAIGEKTGELEETLKTIGAYYDNEADNATQKAVAKLEPTILIFLAIFAGFIVIAIYLPMFTMYDLM